MPNNKGQTHRSTIVTPNCYKLLTKSNRIHKALLHLVENQDAQSEND